jgi:hypothetical protein
MTDRDIKKEIEILKRIRRVILEMQKYLKGRRRLKK